MTGSKDMLADIDFGPSLTTRVQFGDANTSKVLGLVKVIISPDSSIEKVLLVETCAFNLLSVRQLSMMGLCTFFDKDMITLMWSQTLKVAFVGHVEDDMYVVDFSKVPTKTAMCLMAKVDVGWLWHRRLAHVNMRSLQTLLNGEHVVGLTNVSFAKDRACRACIEGKLHEKNHPVKNIISSKRPLELLHMDLFGPPSYDSLGGRKYCLVIVDDYSRYTWVYFFKRKSETQQTVIEFANEAQRQHNSKILAIRSDNGTEFKNYTLDEFLGDEGIKHQYFAAYTPQQNGAAERKNRTLIDAARTMMVEFKSPYNFWSEAINTACHATNCLYLRKILNKTPYEILTGKKPNIKYFRVFGCKCFILKKGVRLSKFESKTNEGIFVGYTSNSHAYRVYNKSSGLVEESSNVEFHEHNGSQVGESDLNDVGDEIPPQAIRRMGVGHFLPVEEPLVVEGEGQCSTHVDPSPPQDPQANQEQDEGPLSPEQDQGQDPIIEDGGEPNDDQDQVLVQGQAQDDEQVLDGAPSFEDDSLEPSQEAMEEERVRRALKIASRLKSQDLSVDQVLGSIQKGVTTCSQLRNFCAHNAFCFLC